MRESWKEKKTRVTAAATDVPVNYGAKLLLSFSSSAFPHLSIVPVTPFCSAEIDQDNFIDASFLFVFDEVLLVLVSIAVFVLVVFVTFLGITVIVTRF